MKRLLSLAFLTPIVVSAQDFGTKKDIMVAAGGSSSAGAGLMPFIQMMVALGLVLIILKFALPKLMTKMSKKLVTQLDGGIQIEESANFAGGNLYVVKARSKTLLLSVNQSGVNCLADLTDSTPAQVETNSFDALLSQEEAKPVTHTFTAAVHVEEDDEIVTPQPAGNLSEDEIQLALRRLQRLAG